MLHELRGRHLGLTLCLIVLAMTPGRTSAPQAPAAAGIVDVESIGPQVGDVLPDFTLSDQRGKPHSLQSILGPNGAVIVFFRSADW
jgi:hypothetical protein